MMKVLPQLHLTLSKESGTEIVTPEFGSPAVKVKKEMRDEETGVKEETLEIKKEKESPVATKMEKVKRKRVVSSSDEEEEEEEEEYQENGDLARNVHHSATPDISP